MTPSGHFPHHPCLLLPPSPLLSGSMIKMGAKFWNPPSERLIRDVLSLFLSHPCRSCIVQLKPFFSKRLRENHGPPGRPSFPPAHGVHTPSHVEGFRPSAISVPHLSPCPSPFRSLFSASPKRACSSTVTLRFHEVKSTVLPVKFAFSSSPKDAQSLHL